MSTETKTEPTTWDWRARDYAFTPKDEGRKGQIAFWLDGGWGSPQLDGRNPSVGDYLILRSPTSEHGTRYQVTKLKRPSITCEMVWASVKFAPRG